MNDKIRFGDLKKGDRYLFCGLEYEKYNDSSGINAKLGLFNMDIDEQVKPIKLESEDERVDKKINFLVTLLSFIILFLYLVLLPQTTYHHLMADGKLLDIFR